MSSDCNTPAFPQPLCCNPDGTHVAPIDVSPIFGGMTLRDYFAGQAAAGILANPDLLEAVNRTTEGTPLELAAQTAKIAYMHADALLDAREAQ